MGNFKVVVNALGYFGIVMLVLGVIFGSKTLFTVALISLGIILIILIWSSLKEKLFHNRNQGLIFWGVFLSILGFVLIFTTFFSQIYLNLAAMYGQPATLLEGYNLCNSWLGQLGSATSDDVLTSCRSINMFFYLSIISLILGIILIIIGLMKRK